MKVTPVSGPGAIQDTSTPEAIRTAKAVAAFQRSAQTQGVQSEPDANTAQQPPVNANAISAEEVGAVKAQTNQENQESSDAPTVESEVTAPEQDPELKRRFEQIARQERALRAKAQDQDKRLKAREAALAAREAAVQQPTEPDLSNYVDKARIKQDAISVLEEAGISWDELTNQAINRQNIDPRVTNTISRLEAKIAQLEKATEASQKTYEQQQQDSYQAAVKQITSDAKQLVYTDPEFETVKAMNAVNDVVDLIKKQHAADGTVLSVEEAAREVENYLVEEAMKITQIDKIKKRMAAANASKPPTEAKTQASKQPQMKTLTNATSSSRPLTARERAIAAMEGRLKS